MLDNVLIPLLITNVKAVMTSIGQPYPIIQKYQPTQTGVPTAATIFLYKLFDDMIGQPAKQDIWNLDTEQFDHVETQQYASHFQMSALSTQDPANQSQLTASDILNYARYAVQSAVFVAAMEGNGVGIFDVSQVRNTYFEDERDQFEASPSFDFVLTHKQIIVTTTPIVQSEVLQILRV